MSKKGPCPKCGSSDALELTYPSGPYCFSCGTKFHKDKEPSYVDPAAYTYQQVPYRSGRVLATLQRYNIKVKVSNATGEPFEVDYEYPDGAIKYRDLKQKRFTFRNHRGPSLYGIDKFSAGSAMACTITEGEEDAHAVYEMTGFKYPAFSVQGSSSAQKDCAAEYDKLMAFDKIYLCFDNDEPGRKALEAVSSLFPYEKIYVVKKTKYKDADEYRANQADEEYRKCWYNAKRHDPDNLVSSFSDIATVFEKPSKKAIAHFPFRGLEEATFGIRTGETYLIKALEGIGKTEILGACEYHAAKTTTLPIGIIHLEEDLKRTAMRFVNYEVAEPVHLEGMSRLTDQQMVEIFKTVAQKDNRLVFYKRGKNDTDVNAFLNAIRFMVAQAGCKIVFFDHISRVATSFNLDTAGLDNFATRLSELAEELDFALIMISHVNADGDTRGSKNISKEAWTVISLRRDLQAEDAADRNTTYLVIEKNRHASITGPAGAVYFSPHTFMVTDEKQPRLPPRELHAA